MFVLCATANFAQSLSFNLFLHFPGYLAQLGADEVQIGFIFGLTAFAAIAARPPVGRIMDRRGRRSVILAGGVINVLACALYLGVASIGPAIYAIRIVHGLAEALLFSSLFTLAADLVPPARRTEGLAWFGASGMLPIALAGLLGDALLARFDYSVLFATSVGLAVVSLAALAAVARSRADRRPARAVPRLPRRARAARSAPALVDRHGLLGRHRLGVRLHEDLRDAAPASAAWAPSSAPTPVRLSSCGWPRAGCPIASGPSACSTRRSRSCALGLALLAQASTPTHVLVAGLCCGTGHGFVFPILSGMVVTRAREADRGSALAIFTALFDAGVLIGGPSLGAVIRAAGYPVMYGLAALWIACGSAVFVAWERRR